MKQDTLEEHIPASVARCRDGEYSFRIELPTKAEAEQEARDAIAWLREFKAKERQRAKHFASEQVFHAS